MHEPVIQNARARYVLLPAICALAFFNMAAYSLAGESVSGPSTWENYAGFFLGTARIGNHIHDLDGFANWGNPGSTQRFSHGDVTGGGFVGQRFDNGTIGFRYEFEAMIGGRHSATTSNLDPTCPDESAATRFRWITAVRFGVDRNIDNTRLFAVAGPALARIENSVTDTDYSGRSCLERDLRLDPDDSFRDESVHSGWTLGAGFEVKLDPQWMLRFEGTRHDFGHSSYQVNLSANNRCGRGGDRKPCTYSVRNRLTTLRVAIVYHFGL